MAFVKIKQAYLYKMSRTDEDAVSQYSVYPYFCSICVMWHVGLLGVRVFSIKIFTKSPLSLLTMKQCSITMITGQMTEPHPLALAVSFIKTNQLKVC